MQIRTRNSTDTIAWLQDGLEQGLAGLSSLEGLTIKCSTDGSVCTRRFENILDRGLTSDLIQLILQGLQGSLFCSGAKHLKFLRLPLLNSKLNLSW